MTVKTTTRMIVRCMMKDSSAASSTHYAARHRPTKRWMLYLEVVFLMWSTNLTFSADIHTLISALYIHLFSINPHFTHFTYIGHVSEAEPAAGDWTQPAPHARSAGEWGGGEGEGGEEKENRKEERGEEMNLLQPLVMCVVWCTHFAVSVVLYRTVTIQVPIY